MQRNPIEKLIYLACAGTGLILILNYLAIRRDHLKSGFDRHIRYNMLRPVSTVELPDYGYYFAGANDSTAYFGNYQLPDHVLTSTLSLSRKQVRKYTMPVPVRWTFLDVSFRQNRLYFADRSLSLVCSVDTRPFASFQVQRIPHPFAAFYPAAGEKCILTVWDTAAYQYNLATYRIGDSGTHISHAVKMQKGMILSVDGMILQADPNTFVYTYYYRNQVLILDSNLNTLNYFTTIDTISVMNNKATATDNGRKITLSSPPVFVNKLSCIYKNLLFVQSAARADNETKQAFDANTVIDVYTLPDGTYQFSFYAPNGGHGRISSMGTSGSFLILTFKSRFASSFHLLF